MCIVLLKAAPKLTFISLNFLQCVLASRASRSEFRPFNPDGKACTALISHDSAMHTPPAIAPDTASSIPVPSELSSNCEQTPTWEKPADILHREDGRTPIGVNVPPWLIKLFKEQDMKGAASRISTLTGSFKEAQENKRILLATIAHEAREFKETKETRKTRKERLEPLMHEFRETRDARARAGAILTINRRAIRENYRFALNSVAPGTQCAVVLKANGYGIGAAEIASAVMKEGCRHFFVAHLDEAKNLRQGLIAKGAAHDAIEIFVLHGPPVGAEKLFHAPEYNAVPVLNSLQQVEAWGELAADRGKTLPAILQFDTGMRRAGLSKEDTATLLQRREALLKHIEVRYVMSHLACAGDSASPFNPEQLAAFNSLRTQFPDTPASLSASPGTHLGPDYHFDLVRLGSFVLGVEAPHPLNPVIKLQAKIMQTRWVEAEQGIGYGQSGVSRDKRRLIANVSCGFADGLPRGLSNRGKVYIDGKPVSYVGNMSMDMLTLDVTDIDPNHLTAGTLVDLVCEQYTLDEMAKDAGTICADITTKFQDRIFRRSVNVPVILRPEEPKKNPSQREPVAQ